MQYTSYNRNFLVVDFFYNSVVKGNPVGIETFKCSKILWGITIGENFSGDVDFSTG